MAPPNSVITAVEKNQCQLFQAGRDFTVSDNNVAGEGHWTLQSPFADMNDLPPPNLAGEFQKYNSATAILALQALQANTLIAAEVDITAAATSALERIILAGRFQKLHEHPLVVADVAHNPQAALALSLQLKLTAADSNKTWAIVAMLADKDIAGVLENVREQIDCWCFAGLENTPRGMPLTAFIQAVPKDFFGGSMPVMKEENRHDLALNQCTMLSETVLLARGVEQACELVLSKASDNDRLIIFGSFYTVAESMHYFSVNNDTVELNK